MSSRIPSFEIGKVVSTVKKWNPSQSGLLEPFNYIDLSSVDQKRKRIVGTQKIHPKEAPSRARQLIHEGDILVSTERPNINGVAYVPRELDGATASTGFCVLRPKEKELDGRYLFYWVQTSNFMEEMVRLATGANYPAISDRVVKESEIPLPPLAEQKRIAAILDKADAIRRKRRQAIQLADEFLRSVFLDMFGDPINNSKGWPQKKLAELAQIIVPSRDKPKSFTGAIPWVTLPDIDGLFVGSAKNMVKHDEARDVKNRLMPKDTVLISCAGSLSVSAIATRDLYANQQFYGLYSKKEEIEPLYLLFNLYNRPEDFYKKLAGTVTISFYSKQKAADILIGLPPKELQNNFSRIVLKHKDFLSASHKSYRISNAFFKSLTQRAFRGEI